MEYCIWPCGEVVPPDLFLEFNQQENQELMFFWFYGTSTVTERDLNCWILGFSRNTNGPDFLYHESCCKGAPAPKSIQWRFIVELVAINKAIHS